uniref:Uncharacterized protein n=1 Tax=Arundo donax TaxID=35708 RepID=A0A0A9E7J0_ARUDO
MSVCVTRKVTDLRTFQMKNSFITAEAYAIFFTACLFSWMIMDRFQCITWYEGSTLQDAVVNCCRPRKLGRNYACLHFEMQF